MRTAAIAIALLLTFATSLRAETPRQLDDQLNRIYQYFVPGPDVKRPNLGAYLWIPPNTPKIRAVMVALHNGLPINIIQSAPVRAVCRKYGIATVLLMPWASDLGKMVSPFYDVTDPARTAVYDSYFQRLAEASGHPELVNAPIVPLGHSAYCEFPFDAAIRNPDHCLAAIPIKAGLPDVYSTFKVGGAAKAPTADMSLRNIPILFVTSASQETVSWQAYPRPLDVYGPGSYRRDHDDNAGTTYEARNDLFGGCWNMMSGHFDMFPKDYQFVADWLAAIAAARLPDDPGQPLKTITLKDGWLMNPNIPASGDLPKDYPMPAPYLDFKGHRNQALWFPNGDLANRLFETGRDQPRKKIEIFTLLDPSGKPIDLSKGRMAPMPNPETLLHDDGLITLTSYRFTTPPQICTVSDRDHKLHPEIPLKYDNVIFPGQTSIPTSDLPLDFNAHGGALEFVSSEQFKDDRGIKESRLTLRVLRHRIDPDTGFNMSFVRVFHEGNDEFAPSGRTCQIAWALGDKPKDGKEQTVDFPTIADAPASTDKLDLHATSSAGLKVDYFVFKGPGLIRDGAFIPTEVPAGLTKPIEVTIGAYQVGLFKSPGGVRPAATVYRTFHLLPAAQH
jgi:hypothetical protein